MRIITTTSIADTGLLQALKSEYQKESGKDITVISKGSGEADDFGKWLLESTVENLIRHFGEEEYGKALFVYGE